MNHFLNSIIYVTNVFFVGYRRFSMNKCSTVLLRCMVLMGRESWTIRSSCAYTYFYSLFRLPTKRRLFSYRGKCSRTWRKPLAGQLSLIRTKLRRKCTLLEKNTSRWRSEIYSSLCLTTTWQAFALEVVYFWNKWHANNFGMQRFSFQW